ncbi:MAG TPA: thrombospondin type 3 repeat-containing protein [Candidatus Thermoplasmatota archaeon]|nr:thrombospondin type 3 repeat-containing protein [Candidatus Thermoplasmatota archaeon]
MVSGGVQRLGWNLALVASLVLAGLAAASSPVMSHGTATPGESPGHDKSSADPLNAFSFYGPKGTMIENKPCPPASDRYVGTSHISHIYAFEGLNPEEGNWLAVGSTDLYHYDVFEDPRHAEGPYPDGDMGTMYGVDGYARSRFQATIFDGTGYDIRIHDFHEWSSFCLYGALDKAGPYLFLGTAFQNQQGCPGKLSCMDLKYYYRDLFAEHYPHVPGSARMDYLFGIGAVERFRGLRADFTTVPKHGVEGWTPGTLVEFIDQSDSYGFPDPSSGKGGIVTDTDMKYTDEDLIKYWDWYFDTDPSKASNIMRCGQYCYSAVEFDSGKEPNDRMYNEVGEFEVCLVVTTEGDPNYQPPIPPDKDDECKLFTVRDLPPVARFKVESRGCYFPAVHVVDHSYEPPQEPVVKQSWDWGDGSQSSGPKAEHTYAKSGTYTVRLTVWDNDGETDSYETKVIAKGAEDCGNPPAQSGDEGMYSTVPQDGKASVGDSDGDGVPDDMDSCPTSSEAGEDADGDGVGDACDPDRDGDFVENHLDNCPRAANPYQEDLDGDGFGDACDPDADADGVPDLGGNGRAVDNCRLVPNADQLDLDLDGVGDACDEDKDGDMVPDLQDQYPLDKARWSDALRSYNREEVQQRNDQVQVYAASRVTTNPLLVLGVVAFAALAVVVALLVVRRKAA